MIRTLDVALSQIGIKEATSKNDGTPAERFMDGDELPWCAGFLLWCNRNSQDPPIARNVQERYAFRSVQTLMQALKDRGKWWARGVKGPAPNDLIIFDDLSDVAVAGCHVGIVWKIEGGRIHTVEGNTSNEVASRSYPIGDKRILGYGSIGWGAPAT